MLYKSLHLKLVLVLVLFIIIITGIIAALMLNGVFDFYTGNFINIMKDTLSGGLTSELVGFMTGENYFQMQNRLRSEYGRLGITPDYRDLYILDMDGGYIAGTNDMLGASLIITPNMLAAMNKQTGDRQSFGLDYMDYAVYLSNEAAGLECIIYIKDNQEEMRSLSWSIFAIMMQALLIGLLIAVVFSFFFARAITSPIQNITKSAVKLADGSFNKKIEVKSNDEIGTLTLTFNEMAKKLKYMLDQSEELELSRREFIANVSHELRTPLANIYGAAETIEEGRVADEVKIRCLNIILTESVRMKGIVRDLLIVSKLDNRKMMWQFAPMNPVEVAETINEAMRGEAEKKGQALILETGENIPGIYADRARIEQVLVNIVSNAIKYTPEGGKIVFSLGGCGQGIKFTVTDDGVGIPEQDLPRIFERFYRVDKARSSEAGGTGLGLSIAKEIVEAHSGKITVDSAPGKGAEVTIILPEKPAGAEGM